MLYQKLLLDLPDLDDIRTKFSNYWLKSLISIADNDQNIKNDNLSDGFEMEHLMDEFGILFGPLGSIPGNRSNIGLYLDEIASSFMVLASRGFDQFTNLPNEVKFRCELADVVLILSLTQNNTQWQKVLQKEFEIVLNKYVSILPKQPSEKAKELLLKTVQKVGENFFGYINSKVEINSDSKNLEYQEDPDEKFSSFLSYLSAQKLNQEQIDQLNSKLFVLNEDLDREIELNEKGVPAYILLQDRLKKESVENYVPEICEMFLDHITLVKYEYLDKQNVYKEYTGQDYPISLCHYIIVELYQTALQSEDYKLDKTLWESFWGALTVYFNISVLELKKITENTKEALLKSEKNLLGSDQFCRKSYRMEFYKMLRQCVFLWSILLLKN